jgi:methionyl-tRNA synthetase
LSWGIELPFDRDYVNYVWFDALSNYISFAGYDPVETFDQQPAEFRARWPALHVIGKDILVPAHGVYWPIMLHALGFPDEQMPTLLVHGWWNVSGAKMSKSLGNVVDPEALIDKYGTEALRYYLMSDIVTGKDADFSEKRLIERYNADLANSLGNLLNRTLSMTQKYSYRKLQQEPISEEQFRSDLYVTAHAPPPSNLEESMRLVHTYPKLYYNLEYIEALDGCHPEGALGNVINYSRHCDLLVEIAAPWKLAADDSKRKTLELVLYHLAEALRIIAIWISPVLPKAAHGIFDQLNWKMELSGKEERFSLVEAEWGQLPDDHVVGKPVPLFPRIETPL